MHPKVWDRGAEFSFCIAVIAARNLARARAQRTKFLFLSFFSPEKPDSTHPSLLSPSLSPSLFFLSSDHEDIWVWPGGGAGAARTQPNWAGKGCS